tara:strand:+ start:4319 stop:4687 length:369 start_codon:yes stop_codon:yes gene_type:complete
MNKTRFLNGKIYSDSDINFNNAIGVKEWYLNDLRHREDGPAIEWASGSKEWYLNGLCHRKDGPAVDYANGTKAWCLNGLRHRVDGPAVEYANGNKQWYYHGKNIHCKNNQEFLRMVKLMVFL